MSLDTTTFKSTLKDIYTRTRTGEGDADAALDAFLTDFVEATRQFVESATINYISGLAAPGGPVTGTFEGNLT